MDSALAPGYPEDPLVEGFRVTLKRSDLATLSNLNWLNDEVQFVLLLCDLHVKGHLAVFLVKRTVLTLSSSIFAYTRLGSRTSKLQH